MKNAEKYIKEDEQKDDPKFFIDAFIGFFCGIALFALIYNLWG